MSEKLETPTSIDFNVIFNKDKITIDPTNLSGQGTRTFNMPDDSNVIIQSIPGTNVDKSQSLIMLPFTGENKDILLGEAVAKLSDGTEKNLSI
ncbi:MAG: hypothetical protein WCP92_07085 [bacterium]